MSQIKAGDAVRTPLHELLRRIPRDAKYTWTDEDGYYHSVPIGSLAHQAADRLVPDGLAERVRAMRDDYRQVDTMILTQCVADDLDALLDRLDPQPSAQVTKEELAEALSLVVDAMHETAAQICVFANRLRAQEEGE